jgi:uncharacterized protein
MPQSGDDSLPMDLDVTDDNGSHQYGASASKNHAHGESRSILSAPIIAITRLVLSFPLATLAIAIGITVVCAALTASRLNYKSSRLDLLNPKSDYNRLWLEYIDEFGDEDDAVIVVEGAGRDAVIPVLAELSTALGEEKRLFHAILHELDLSKVRAKGLHYLSVEELQRLSQNQLPWALSVVGGQWSNLQVGRMLGDRSKLLMAASRGVGGYDVTTALSQIEHLANGMLAALGPSPRYQSPLQWEMPAALATLTDLRNDYFTARNGELGFVLLRLAVGKDEFARGNEAINALRQLIAQTNARHPEVKIGLTGLPIMENDEMNASQSSMFWASAISLLGVALVVVAGFGGVRHAIMANIVLLIGMAWAFGYVTLTVGHLNILSVTFTVTLIGIGIDYGTYYISRYMQYRRAGLECEESLVETTRTIGASIATGAITTSVAFFAAGLTKFVGVSELGIIAGGGILLCCVAQLFVLPALIHVVDHTRWGKSAPAPLPIHSWVNPFLKLPKLMMIGGAVATAIAAIGMKDLWYDHNLLNMQPQGLESVELEHKLLSEDQSMWYALSIGTRQDLLERKEKFLKLESVERVEEIVSLMPADLEVKQPIIADINNRLGGLAERPPAVAIDPIDELGAALAQAQQLAMQQNGGVECARRLELVRDALRRLPAPECYERISQFQQQVAGELLSRLHTLRSVADPQPPQLTDLSDSLVRRFVGQNGKYLLKIYGRGDIWDMQALSKFVHEVRGVDPRATGNPLQAYEASLEMKQSFEHAALYALLVITAVLYLEFRNLRHCALAALPLGMGLAATFGLLGFMNQPLNPANLIALPLLLGIGIDYGVHIVHEYLEQSGRYRMSQATAVAVLVDALTTIIGFGSLMIASHRGLQSLGRVLTLGVAACTIASLWCLPAFLAWVTRKRPLVPWVPDAVESYDHEAEPAEFVESAPIVPTRRAA